MRTKLRSGITGGPTVGDLVVDRVGWEVGRIRELQVDLASEEVTLLLTPACEGAPGVMVPRDLLVHTERPHTFALRLEDVLLQGEVAGPRRVRRVLRRPARVP